MTQEEKQLLLKDLCARLPYRVKGLHREQVHIITNMDGDSLYPSIQVDGYDAWFPVETFKPYLRPMSSMTEEERKELNNYENSVQRTDFFYSHHIDCRFMIEKGLALEALEGMYKTE